MAIDRNALAGSEVDAPAPVRRNVLADPTATALFLGENSRTANHAQLAVARQMVDQGYSPDDIRQATGWFFHTWPEANGQGSWSYEIDDRPFQQRGPRAVPQSGAGAFFDHFSHPAVQEAYPELSNMQVQRQPMSDAHAFHSIGQDDQGQMQQGVHLRGNDYRNRLNIPLHELQHSIDAIEGVESIPQPVNPRTVDDPAEQRSLAVEQRRQFTDEQRRQYWPLGRHHGRGSGPPAPPWVGPERQ